MHKSLHFSLICLLCIAILLPNSAEASRQDFITLLTPEEQAYIAQDPLITVAFSPNKGPIQYMDQTGELQGISKDVLELASDLTGLRFSSITLSNMAEMRKAINSGTAQILSGIPIESEIQEAYSVEFGKPYLACSYGVLLPRGGDLDDRNTLRLALPVGLDIPKDFQNVHTITRFASIAECIQAVNDGKADFTYGNSYVLEFYAQGYRFQNLSVVPVSDRDQQICFGVAKDADPRLISILDKFITYIGQEGLLNITVKNVAVSTQPNTLIYWISLNPIASVSIGLMILILISVLAALLLKNSRRKAVMLRLEHQRYLLLSKVAQEYFYEYNFQTDTLILNKETAELFGTKEVFKKWSAQLKTTSQLDPTNIKLLETLYSFPQETAETDSDSINRGLELALPLANGEKRWFRLTRVVLYQQGHPTFSIGKLIDIEEEYRTRHELMQKSVTDGMTGLYNSVAAKELIDRAAQASREGVLFMLDLDNFKQVNDQYGHQTGDYVLKELAKILQQIFRKNDIIGRVGGDEFIVYAQNTSDREFIDKKCRQLQEAVGKIQVDEGQKQSVSIGVAIMTPPCLYEQLYQQADNALYVVKKNGRSGYHIYP